MKAPNKISRITTYIDSDKGKEVNKKTIEYIRKDIVDETVKTAEDHAFFAGQEKFREEMLEWAKEQTPIIEKLNDKGAMLKAWNTLIEKLSSM